MNLGEALANLASRGHVLPDEPKGVGSYGDSESLSRELIGLIRGGEKRATASLVWACEADGEALPVAGQLEIVLDHRGVPVMLTRTTHVAVKPFTEVDAEFAAREGEGDRTLADWRRGHWAFFSRECARIGREPSTAMPVVCVDFELVAAFDDAPVLFAGDGFTARDLVEDDLPMLQAFFMANPKYFLDVQGVAPRPDEARQEFEDRPPAGMPFERAWVVGLFTPAGKLAGVASGLSHFLARDVWHVGLFIVDARLHGTGFAASAYRGLEAWIRTEGAHWIRLGAVLGNTRAERFWERMGYVEVRRREDVRMLERVNTLRVFVKDLAGRGIAAYLDRVERDRP